MQPQLDTNIVSSFLLFVDHEIQRQGLAYSNKSGLFYPDTNRFNGVYTYTCSYKQLCNDTSISGANVMSGVYLNGNYVTVGQSGLVSINHYDGSVNFNQQLPQNTIISGNFGVKDFSVYLSDQPDYNVLLNSKYHSNPKYAQLATGIAQSAKSMPAVILVPKDQETRPFAFAGIDDNHLKIRAMIVCENVYQRISICSILKNLRLKQMNLIYNTPFDSLGNMTGINYNYNNLQINTNYSPYILKAKSSEIPTPKEIIDTVKQFAMVDFDISTWGGHM